MEQTWILVFYEWIMFPQNPVCPSGCSTFITGIVVVTKLVILVSGSKICESFFKTLERLQNIQAFISWNSICLYVMCDLCKYVICGLCKQRKIFIILFQHPKSCTPLTYCIKTTRVITDHMCHLMIAKTAVNTFRTSRRQAILSSSFSSDDNLLYNSLHKIVCKMVFCMFVCFGFYVTSTQYRSYRDVPA
jgi:hypothetical protein